jgi:hypothetical protein
MTHTHTHTHTHTQDLSGLGIGSSQLPLPAQPATFTRYRHPRRRRDSNPQSQQASGLRSTPFRDTGHRDRTHPILTTQNKPVCNVITPSGFLFLPPMRHKHANMFLKRNAPSPFVPNYIHLAVYLHVYITKKIKQHIEEECTMHTLPRLVSASRSLSSVLFRLMVGKQHRRMLAANAFSTLVAIADSRQATVLPARIYKQV